MPGAGPADLFFPPNIRKIRLMSDGFLTGSGLRGTYMCWRKSGLSYLRKYLMRLAADSVARTAATFVRRVPAPSNTYEPLSSSASTYSSPLRMLTSIPYSVIA
jgi:hypothetical protein